MCLRLIWRGWSTKGGFLWILSLKSQLVWRSERFLGRFFHSWERVRRPLERGRRRRLGSYSRIRSVVQVRFSRAFIMSKELGGVIAKVMRIQRERDVFETEKPLYSLFCTQ
jgi:hypothetical protein